MMQCDSETEFIQILWLKICMCILNQHMGDLFKIIYVERMKTVWGEKKL